uniref:Uncharacterized protein n=1 Tax=Rhizophora mucronata TaxID=61149 RepID=A0A2P2QQK4_RHIMU
MPLVQYNDTISLSLCLNQSNFSVVNHKSKPNSN